MSEQYIEILKHFTYNVWIIIFVVLIAFLFVFLITIFLKKKKNKKIEKTDIAIWSFLVSLVIACGLIETVPVYMDIKGNDIEQIEYISAYYFKDYTDESASPHYTPITAELQNGSKIDLKAYVYFPNEMKNGTIIYARHSTIILEYTGDVVSE